MVAFHIPQIPIVLVAGPAGLLAALAADLRKDVQALGQGRFVDVGTFIFSGIKLLYIPPGLSDGNTKKVMNGIDFCHSVGILVIHPFCALWIKLGFLAFSARSVFRRRARTEVREEGY